MTTKEKLEQIFGEIKESEWVEYAKVNRLIDELAKERERTASNIETFIKFLFDKEGMDDGDTIIKMMKEVIKGYRLIK